jgi:hypothetical protein
MPGNGWKGRPASKGSGNISQTTDEGMASEITGDPTVTAVVGDPRITGDLTVTALTGDPRMTAAGSHPRITGDSTVTAFIGDPKITANTTIVAVTGNTGDIKIIASRGERGPRSAEKKDSLAGGQPVRESWPATLLPRRESESNNGTRRTCWLG